MRCGLNFPSDFLWSLNFVLYFLSADHPPPVDVEPSLVVTGFAAALRILPPALVFFAMVTAFARAALLVEGASRV
jgi:hypothetical protein